MNKNIARTPLGLTLLCLLATLIPWLGCSADDPGGEAEPLTESAFLEEYAAALCPRVSSCCAAEGRPYDPAICEYSSVADLQLAKTKLKSQGLPWQFNVEYAQQCLAEARALPSDCSTRSSWPSCSRVFTGSRELGESCFNSWECRPQQSPSDEDSYTLCAVKSNNSLFCQLVSRVRDVGESCDAPVGPDHAPKSVVETCMSTSFCDWDDVCVALSDIGGACPCLDDLYCDGTNTCVAKKVLGDPCEYDGQCLKSRCEEGVCQPWADYPTPWCATKAP